MRGRFWRVGRRQLASVHSWGPYASPSTWYWYTRVLQWLWDVPARPPNLILAQSGAQDDSIHGVSVVLTPATSGLPSRCWSRRQTRDARPATPERTSLMSRPGERDQHRGLSIESVDVRTDSDISPRSQRQRLSRSSSDGSAGVSRSSRASAASLSRTRSRTGNTSAMLGSAPPAESASTPAGMPFASSTAAANWAAISVPNSRNTAIFSPMGGTSNPPPDTAARARRERPAPHP